MWYVDFAHMGRIWNMIDLIVDQYSEDNYGRWEEKSTTYQPVWYVDFYYCNYHYLLLQAKYFSYYTKLLLSKKIFFLNLSTYTMRTRECWWTHYQKHINFEKTMTAWDSIVCFLKVVTAVYIWTSLALSWMIQLIQIKICAPLDFVPSISAPLHPYFTVNLPFFHSLLAFFLLPLIFALLYRAHLLPLRG